MKIPAHSSPITGEGYGYVYVMSYPGSDKVKIGHAQNPSIRASQIGGTLAPEKPQIEALFWCSERRSDVERSAHRIGAAQRCNGEWFAVSVGRAIEIIQRASSQTGVQSGLVFDRDDYEAKLEADKVVVHALHEGMDLAQLRKVLWDYCDTKLGDKKFSHKHLRSAQQEFLRSNPKFAILLNQRENEEQLKAERIQKEAAIIRAEAEAFDQARETRANIAKHIVKESKRKAQLSANMISIALAIWLLLFGYPNESFWDAIGYTLLIVFWVWVFCSSISEGYAAKNDANKLAI
jgi:hypothetical protein